MNNLVINEIHHDLVINAIQKKTLIVVMESEFFGIE